MHGTLSGRMVVVVMLVLLYGAGRATAQDPSSGVPAINPHAARPSSFSLASAYGVDLGLRDSHALLAQSGQRNGNGDDNGMEQDDVAARQSMDSFTSLEDGQPGGPGALELRMDFGWSKTSGESEEIIWEPELKYTGHGSEFLRNMKLAITVPFDVGDGGIDGNGDAEFSWQQRWVTENGDMPTMATIVSLRAPTGYQSSGIDGTLTGIVAKDFGPGTVFLNGWVTSANGNNLENRRDLQWGGRVAYLWRCAEDAALTIDYVHQTSEERSEPTMNLLEFGAQFAISDKLIVGPGVYFGLDGRDSTPDFGAGVRVTYGF